MAEHDTDAEAKHVLAHASGEGDTADSPMKGLAWCFRQVVDRQNPDLPVLRQASELTEDAADFVVAMAVRLAQEGRQRIQADRAYQRMCGEPVVENG